MLYLLKWITPLTFLYIALTANVEPLNWLLGILLAIGITTLLRPNSAPIRWHALPMALLAMTQFVLLLLWELLISSLQVTRLIMQREIPLRQGIFSLPTGSSSPFVTLLSAQAITLTPGELVVEIDDEGLMYIHSLDVVTSVEKEPTTQQRRAQKLERVFLS